jgi:hypothetical protein
MGMEKIKCNDHKTKEIESFKYLGRKTVKNKQKKSVPLLPCRQQGGDILFSKFI